MSEPAPERAPSGRPVECLAVFQSRLRALIEDGTGGPNLLFHPKGNECGVILRDPDPEKRFLGLVVSGRGMLKTVQRPYGPPETWDCKLRVFTRADLGGLLVTTLEGYGEPDSKGRVVRRRFARLKEFPEWDHEVLILHLDGDCIYYMRHEDAVHAERPVRAVAAMILEHVRTVSGPRGAPLRASYDPIRRAKTAPATSNIWREGWRPTPRS